MQNGYVVPPAAMLQLQQMALHQQQRPPALPAMLPAPGTSFGEPFIEELPHQPAEQLPCAFCGGNHVQSKCTQYKVARDAYKQVKADKAAKQREAAAAKKLEAAAAAGAVPAAIVPP